MEVPGPQTTSGGASDASPAVERVRELLNEVARAAEISVEVLVSDEVDCVLGQFAGEDAELLVGDHGRTIDAIQHLAYRTAFPGASPRKSVVIDAAGYRERRAAALRAAADQAVETAIGQGRPVALSAMNAIERKLVHEHLRDRRGIETYSEGEEPDRRLVVAPIVGAE